MSCILTRVSWLLSAMLLSGAALLCSCEEARAASPAADPVDLCDQASDAKSLPQSPANDTADAEDALLGGASRDAEALIAQNPDQVSAADRAIALLQAATRRGASHMRSATMAMFCTAAGEAYRLGKGGSPYQARLLLSAGYRLAVASRKADVSALAAYRLGLLNLGGYATGARGLRRAALRSPAPPRG